MLSREEAASSTPAHQCQGPRLKLRTNPPPPDSPIPNWQGRKVKISLKWFKTKQQSFPLNSTQKVTWGQSMELCSPHILTLHQTFPSQTAVLTERLQMWEGPLIYFPPWFIFLLHITLVWQQCIIRLHVIYKIIAAVQKYSQQESFRSTQPDTHTRTQSDFVNLLLKITQGEETMKSSPSYYVISSVPFLHALLIRTEFRRSP